MLGKTQFSVTHNEQCAIYVHRNWSYYLIFNEWFILLTMTFFFSRTWKILGFGFGRNQLPSLADHFGREPFWYEIKNLRHSTRNYDRTWCTSESIQYFFYTIFEIFLSININESLIALLYGSNWFSKIQLHLVKIFTKIMLKILMSPDFFRSKFWF